MYSLRLTCSPEEFDFISAELWEANTAGIRELEDGLIAGFETNDTREYLLKRFAAHDPEWTQEDATDWVEETQRAWPPRLVGKRIFLAPPWCSDPTPAGRVRVIHNPGLACGTGEHPCTQLALAALENADLQNAKVADIGTGSGVLAIAALRLGATQAIGVDTDSAALQAARENLALNELTAHLVAGSVDCIRNQWADVTVANISSTVLLSLFEDLTRITRGRLILTGFPETEASAFLPGEVTHLDGWCCVVRK